MNAQFRVGTIGKPIQLFVVSVDPETGDKSPKDLSAATTKEIILGKPRGSTTVTHPAVFVTNGTDGGLQYTPTQADELDENGTWNAQAHYILPGPEEDRSSIANFKVGKNLGEGA